MICTNVSSEVPEWCDARPARCPGLPGAPNTTPHARMRDCGWCAMRRHVLIVTFVVDFNGLNGVTRCDSTLKRKKPKQESPHYYVAYPCASSHCLSSIRIEPAFRARVRTLAAPQGRKLPHVLHRVPVCACPMCVRATA